MNINNIKTITRMLPAILSGAILILWFSSCVKSPSGMDDEFSEGEEISVSLALSVAPIESGDSGTRAEKVYIEATEAEKRIHDFWIIEYNEEGTRVGLPRYFTEEGGKALPKDIRIIIPRRDEDTFTCVLIANTNDPEMFSPDNRSEFSTLDDLRRFNTAAHNQETIFNTETGKYLLMSGWTSITTNPETHKLSFELIRNVCKVNVKLTDFPDNILFYKYFQWRDVPLGKMFPHGAIDYHQPVSRDWRQHDEDSLRVILQSPKGLDFYLPSNVWLPKGPHMADTPTDSRPADQIMEEDATHFCVVCRKIEGWRQGEPILSDDQYEYSVYPSKDVDKQFEFRTNHFYQIEMSIKGIPGEDNPFFKIVGYKQLEESNCYMIKRDSKEIFAVPLTRINKFWTSDDANDKFELTDETEWVAEVIWQDTPTRIIDFAPYRGFEAAEDLSYLEGAGETGFAFRPTGTGEGNVIVGVRKKVPGWETIPVEQREYLWSWHLWITDYAPDELDDNGSYNWYYKAVPGGAVHRYPAVEYWETDGAEQYIMDRDLGAKFTFDRTNVLDDMLPYLYSEKWGYRFNDVFPTFGLYYQYGRKDPFPYSEGAYPDNPKDDELRIYPAEGIQLIYDIDGNIIPAFSKHTTMILSAPNEGNFEKAVKHPYVFYTASAASRFWHDPTVGYDEEVSAWLAPDWNDLETGKSIYDPCPPGWRVIPNITVYGTWQDANLQNRVHHYQETSVFLVGSCIDLGDGHHAFYPASGRRDCVYGKIDYESNKEDESEYKHYFKYWTFSGLNEWWLESGDFDESNFDDGDRTNVFSLGNWNYTTGEPAGTGLPVRCIRDVSPQ